MLSRRRLAERATRPPAPAPAPLEGPGCSVRTTEAPAPSVAESSAARGKDKASAAASRPPAPRLALPRGARGTAGSDGTSSSEEEEWNRARAKIPECGSHPAMSATERAELEALLKRYSCAFADSVTATEGTANLLHYEHVIRLTSRLPVFTPRGVRPAEDLVLGALTTTRPLPARAPRAASARAETEPAGPGAARAPSSCRGAGSAPARARAAAGRSATRRGQKPTTWLRCAKGDEWHRLAVAKACPRPALSEPAAAPESDPMELGSDGEAAPPVPSLRPAPAQEPELDEDDAPQADNPRHWRCGPPLYPHQDDPDEGPRARPRRRPPAASTPRDGRSSEPPAASEAPSSATPARVAPAAGLERESSRHAIAPP
eukprot:tig00020555_g10963.t1